MTSKVPSSSALSTPVVTAITPVSPIGEGFWGAGGGGGGKGGRGKKPSEASDSLFSAAKATILMVLSEGPIYGFGPGVNPSAAIYLDNTPLIRADGTANFQDIGWIFLNGYPGEQVPPPYSSQQSEFSVDVPARYAVPITRTFTNSDAVQVVVRVRLSQLYSVDSKGNVKEASVDYRIEISAGNGPFATVSLRYETTSYTETYYVRELVEDEFGNQSWQDVEKTREAFQTTTIDSYRIAGKTNGSYERSHLFNLPASPSKTWSVRVTRTTPDSSSVSTQNDIAWASYTVIEPAAQPYGGCAMFGVSLRSDQFSSVPEAALELYGLIGSVPHNYSPFTGTYSGPFNGSMVPGWTRNPIWLLYSLLTNPIYKMNVPASQLDVFSFYAAAQYCDEVIPDGYGGYEPRFTFTAYLTQVVPSFDLINQIAYTARAAIWWDGSRYRLVQDRPMPVARIYTLANVVCEYSEDGVMTGGGFEYSETEITSRYCEVECSFIDTQSWETAVTKAREGWAETRYGFRKQSLDGFGITSRGQAYRACRWELYVSLFQTEIVAFAVGSEGLIVSPGEIIQINDPMRQGVRIGGRVALDAAAGSTTITLDGDPGYIVVGATLVLVKPDHSLLEARIASVNGTVITLLQPLSAPIEKFSVWAIRSAAFPSQLYKVNNVTENGDGSYTIEAVVHYEEKWAYVDYSASFKRRKVTPFDPLQPPPEPYALKILESLEYDNTTATVKTRAQMLWAFDSVYPYFNGFDVQYKAIADTVWTDLGQSSSVSANTDLLELGTYNFRVRSKNTAGGASRWVEEIYDLKLLKLPPVAPPSLAFTQDGQQAILTWPKSQEIDVLKGGSYVIKYSPLTSGVTWADGYTIGTAPGSAVTLRVPLGRGTYSIKAIDSLGTQSEGFAYAVVDAVFFDNFAVSAVTENPSFSGAKTGVRVNSFAPILEMDYLASFDNALGLFDSKLGFFDDGPEFFDSKSGLFDSHSSTLFDDGAPYPAFVVDGSYLFSNEITFSEPFFVSLEPVLSFTSSKASDLFDYRGGFFDSATGLFDSSIADTSIVRVEVATSVDGTSFTDWSQPRIGYLPVRRAKMRLIASTPGSDYNIAVTELGAIARSAYRFEQGQASSSASGPVRVTFAKKFQSVPQILVTIDSPLSASEIVEITAKTSTYFEFQVLTATSSLIVRSIQWRARGYGESVN